MAEPMPVCVLRLEDESRSLEDYQRGVPRWCAGCGDNAILAAVQRVCRSEQVAPEKTVFISGIGCSSRFPHYMNAYGFHGIHGRALPVAEGIKMTRPDLHVFVSTGDGDCCSIGTAHWIHALRYNMDMTVVLHDNQIYGLTKMQASPTSPRGLKTKTTPAGACLEALNPLTVTLGVSNVSFVRVLQRCPEYLPDAFGPWVKDPARTLLLTHADGVEPSPALAKTYRNQEAHDPLNIDRARELASITDPIPVGVLYRNPHVPRYEDAHDTERYTSDTTRRVLERELDKFTIWPDD